MLTLFSPSFSLCLCLRLSLSHSHTHTHTLSLFFFFPLNISLFTIIATFSRVASRNNNISSIQDGLSHSNVKRCHGCMKCLPNFRTTLFYFIFYFLSFYSFVSCISLCNRIFASFYTNLITRCCFPKYGSLVF